MNYYIDTEFIEGFHVTRDYGTGFFKSLRPKNLHYIDLISIGIVSEDNREYFAVSKDFDLKLVWNKYDLLNSLRMGDPPEKVYWLRENVLRPIYEELRRRINGFAKLHTSAWEKFTYKNLKRLISWYGKTNKQIAAEIQVFTSGYPFTGIPVAKKEFEFMVRVKNKENPPTFYGYYADYDWVLFCSLFGRMLDLPKGYPMYCRDLKQMMDELKLDKHWKDSNVPGDNEHHALADARWNKKLYDMMKLYGGYKDAPTMGMFLK